MTVLRSREILPKIDSNKAASKKTRKKPLFEPETPVKTQEFSSSKPSNNTTPISTSLAQTTPPDVSLSLGLAVVPDSGSVRRSLRLASKTVSSVVDESNVKIRKSGRSFKKGFAAKGDLSCDRGLNMDESVEEGGFSGDFDNRVSDSGHKRNNFGGSVSGNCDDEFNLENVNIDCERAELNSEAKRACILDRIGAIVKDFKEKEGTRIDLNEPVSVERDAATTFGQSAERNLSWVTGKGKRKFGIDVELLESEHVGEGEVETDKGFLSLRSGTRFAKRQAVRIGTDDGLLGKIEKRDEVQVNDTDIDLNGDAMNELGTDPSVDKSDTCSRGRAGRREGKGKPELIGKLGFEVDMTSANADLAHSWMLEIVDQNGPGATGRRRYSRVEKGKGKISENDLSTNRSKTVDPGSKVELEKSAGMLSDTSSLVNNIVAWDGNRIIETTASVDAMARRDYKERFRDIARKNASRFAHFSLQDEEISPVHEAENEVSEREADGAVEDWPGPFSTAMKIIKDREKKANVQQQSVFSDRSKCAPVLWVPKKHRDHHCSMHSVPSLQGLCLEILAKNADAITSLDSVPDVLRHKLSQLLCDSRRMNSHFFDLLVKGSPSEVRVRDCSWLTEEQFSRTFEECDTSNLTVLQLDQCGRCMPDYVLLAILSGLSNGLPVLTTISLKGACRLSDSGLRALALSAPALMSINLSQCSLLTSDGIHSLADSLGSVLRELYMDDCQGIDAMLTLPALLKLERLEVFSMAGMQTVCDDFVRKFIAVRGHNMKELILTDCMKLTDASLKVIAETCSKLCSIDLTNLCKLTDSAIGYLANGCHAIQTLRLCRNAFSDEAVAAYIETCGKSLKELSLNNVNKVAHNTAMSLARCSRDLLDLDLSWCRNLTNEAIGLIVDSCLTLKVLKLFGCTQITNVFLDGHSNPQVTIVGLKMTSVLKLLKVPDPLEGPLHYSTTY